MKTTELKALLSRYDQRRNKGFNWFFCRDTKEIKKLREFAVEGIDEPEFTDFLAGCLGNMLTKKIHELTETEKTVQYAAEFLIREATTCADLLEKELAMEGVKNKSKMRKFLECKKLYCADLMLKLKLHPGITESDSPISTDSVHQDLAKDLGGSITRWVNGVDFSRVGSTKSSYELSTDCLKIFITEDADLWQRLFGNLTGLSDNCGRITLDDKNKTMSIPIPLPFMFTIEWQGIKAMEENMIEGGGIHSPYELVNQRICIQEAAYESIKFCAF